MKSNSVFYNFRGKLFAFIVAFLGGALWAFVGLPRKSGVLCALMHALAIAGWVSAVMSLAWVTIGMKRVMFERKLRVNQAAPFIDQSKGFAFRSDFFNDEGLVVRKRLIENVVIFALAFLVTLGSAVAIDGLCVMK